MTPTNAKFFNKLPKVTFNFVKNFLELANNPFRVQTFKQFDFWVSVDYKLHKVGGNFRDPLARFFFGSHHDTVT